jgi:hypothetical protein
MIPTRRTTLGRKGYRPMVGNLDGHDAIDVFGVLNLVTRHLYTRIVERQRASSRQRSLQAAFARHLRDLARTYPATRYPRVVLNQSTQDWYTHAAILTCGSAVIFSTAAVTAGS